MITPAFALALTLATLWGAAFHFALGGGVGQLARYLVAGWLGFAMGHFVGVALGNPYWKIGAVQVFPASLAAFAFLCQAARRQNRAHTRVR